MANLKVLAATPKVVNTIKQAADVLNKIQLSGQDPTKSNILTTKVDGNLQGSVPIVPAKIKEGNGLTGYLCDIYANGLTEPPTSEGRVFLTNGASSIFVLPPGTVLFVQKYNIVMHGGVE